MTSLMILILAVAVVAAVTALLTRTTVLTASALYCTFMVLLVALDHYVITPTYNIIAVDWAVSVNSNHHAEYRNTIYSYVKSSKWNEFKGQVIQKEAIDKVLSDLRGATEETSGEAYDKLVCYLDEIFNHYETHGRASVRCFGRSLNGSANDNGTIRMWTSLLVYGTSNLKTQPFEVHTKPSIIQQAMYDVEATFLRWEKEDAILTSYNKKQDKLRKECMSIWNRPMTSTSQRFSLQWLHEHCSSKYPAAWTIGDIKH